MISFLVGLVSGVLSYFFFIKPTKFWEDQNVTHVRSWPFVGNMWDFAIRKKHFLDITNDIYNKFPSARYTGYLQFNTPALLIKDLDLVKQIGVKEFDSFHDHQHCTDTEVDPLLSKSLSNLLGDKWQQMRATLSPVFTSNKLKNMYHLMVECSENLVNYFQGEEQVDIEMKNLFSRFANDIIASIAFGIQVDTIKEPEHEFYIMGQEITKFSLVQVLKRYLFQMSPKLAKLFNIRMLRQDIASFFTSIIQTSINKRVKEGIVRPDLIHLMLEAREGKLKHETDQKSHSFAAVKESQYGKSTTQMELTDDHIVAQAILFFLAGFETVSTALSLMAHELAVNPDVQKKLQIEIDEVKEKCDDKVTYDALMAMKYLDQVVCETLRMWPPTFQIDRYCNNKFTIKPKKSNEGAVEIEKGTIVIIPIMSIQRDPHYFPDPDRFDPERFSDENKSKIVPGSYMPFGVGPRNCIGSRFALLEIKTLFFHLLSKFKIVPTKQTEIPLRINPQKISMSPQNGFHLGLKPRSSV